MGPRRFGWPEQPIADRIRRLPPGRSSRIISPVNGVSSIRPLPSQARSFKLRVWNELRHIPYGKTVTYAQVAERIGQPAARPRWTRERRHNIPVLIPCHRVIGARGDLTDICRRPAVETVPSPPGGGHLAVGMNEEDRA